MLVRGSKERKTDTFFLPKLDSTESNHRFILNLRKLKTKIFPVNLGNFLNGSININSFQVPNFQGIFVFLERVYHENRKQSWQFLGNE